MDIKSPVAEARNEYTYSASGAKLKVVQKWNSTYYLSPVIGATINPASLNSSRTMDYVGNIIYENNALDKILVDGGYIEGGVYYFYITDHLGNNRIVANSSGASEQSTHYYPFGTSFVNASGTHPYQYNGKELDQMHGLNLYDYSARYYESAIGRFTTVDPLAEKYYSISPYAYCNNNPLRYIDPTGMDWEDEESRKYAEKLSTNMRNRISSLDKERQTVANYYVKALKSGDSEKAGQLLAEGLELRASIEDLESGITELTAMGDTKDQTFAYKEISGNVGGAIKRSDRVIEMQISGYGSPENGVHESAHGYDLWKGGANTRDNWDTREIKAYGRQYSYNSSSMPSSYWGGIKSRSDITPGWVRGVYSVDGTMKNYLYAKYILQGSNVKYSSGAIEKMLDQRRKNGFR